MIQTHAGFYLWGALLLLILPLDWLLSGLTAAIIHELCHILVLISLGGSVKGIRITASGCIIESEEVSELQALCSLLAGPAGSLALTFFMRTIPQLAVCGLFHGIYNLIPIYPLDGGRILQQLLYRYCPGHADRILLQTGRGVCFGLILLSILICVVYHLGMIPTVLTLLWVQRFLPRKIPCKPSEIGVQ